MRSTTYRYSRTYRSEYAHQPMTWGHWLMALVVALPVTVLVGVAVVAGLFG